MARVQADPEKLARIFKALSVGTRIEIVKLLKDRALCVGALAAQLDVTQGAVSQHLRVLRDLDLVIAEKRGYYVHYRLNEATLGQWKAAAGELLGTATPEKSSPGRKSGRRKETQDV